MAFAINPMSYADRIVGTVIFAPVGRLGRGPMAIVAWFVGIMFVVAIVLLVRAGLRKH